MNNVKASECDLVTIRSGASELGALAVAMLNGEVVGIRFGYSSERAAVAALLKTTYLAESKDVTGQASRHDDDLADDLLERLQRYADGEPVDFSDVPVAIDHLSTFQRRVVKACRAIPAGQRRSYGELAAKAGSPGAARAVGSVMANNRVPLVVPCHRVVTSGGKLGGFSAPQGLAMKKRLLALEAEAVGFDTERKLF